MNLEHFLIPYTEINSKWTKDLNVRPETIKLLEENIGRTLYDINHSKILYDKPPRIKEIKTKINKWVLIKFKYLHSDGNYKESERPHSEWEKITATETTDIVFISKTYKQLIQVSTRETNNPVKKMGKSSKHISPKKAYRWLINT